MESFIICSLASIVLGILGAIAYMYRNSYSKGFVVTLAVLPLMVQVVIALVNGNLGAGVAVAGAFSLIRFRSAQGGGRELGAIFLAMAIGLATGMGYVGIAVILTVAIALMQYVLMTSKFGDEKMSKKQLRISVPENLNYDGIFDEIFERYLLKAEMTKVVDGAGEHYMAQIFAMYLRFRNGSDLAESKEWQNVVMTDADLIITENPGRSAGTLFWYGLEQYLNGSLKSEAASEFFQKTIAALGEKK